MLARGLSPDKYNVHVGVITETDLKLAPFPPTVSVHALGVHRVRAGALGLFRLIQRLQPDIVFSGAPHLNFLVLLLRPLFPRKTRVLVRQTHSASTRFESGRWIDNTPLFYRLLYPHADRVVCQTPAMAADLAQRTGIARDSLRVLPNPIDAETIRALDFAETSSWSGPGPHLLAVGRLAKEKGFDLLLQAFASLRVAYPAADLTIIGKGPQRERLDSICRILGLQSSVRFTGHIERPESFFPGATVFVMPSRHEGLPNSLLEAAAAGLPIVALPAEGGVSELLAGKSGVWLADQITSSSLLRSLLLALRNIHTGDRYAHPWVEEFRMDRAIPRYERLFDEALLRPAR